MREKLIFLELNEINIDFVRDYISQGLLPNWEKLINKHGIQLTTSETSYENIEPWIQWPTIRTGLKYADHKIFRLGDICLSKHEQHWEILEKKGFSVAAISPINGDNRTVDSPFWIPDPWVDTKTSGNAFVQRISKAIKQAVNDNAQEKINFRTALTIAEALIFKSQLSSLKKYFQSIWGSIKNQHWSKAILLDRLLADIYIWLWKKYQPDFSTLFLNAGAHIQHHYMCSSKVYKGNVRNPEWYIRKGKDPLYEILNTYDSILGELVRLPNTRMMLAVGMRQIPYEEVTYYWRLKNHKEFLMEIGMKFSEVQPRMTRDFLIKFETHEDSIKAQFLLESIYSNNDERIFGLVENRGKDIFVTLTYSEDIRDDFYIKYGVNEDKSRNFSKDIVFVAIKNGHHDSEGFFIDTFEKRPEIMQPNSVMPINNIFYKVINHFD